MTDKADIALRIREARELSGLSQGQAAKKLGMHRPTISEIEAGRRNVKADELKNFASLYGVEISWLTNGSVGQGKVDKKIMVAARELSAMSDDDLNTLITTIKMIKSKGKAVE
ncbi:MAG: helix-turn-helix domain-containing protein [Neptuniibacter sp.]